MTFGTNYIYFYKKLKKYIQKKYIFLKGKTKNVMKENEQIIWNSLFSKQNIQNYLIIEPTCPEAKVIVYFGEYYSFCIFWEKAWLMIVNNIHEVNKRLKRARNWQICVKTRARISLLLFRVSFVNSLLIFTLWYFVMTSLVMRPVVYGGHDSKSNLRVSCTKENKNWRRKGGEVYQRRGMTWKMWPWISWAIVKGKKRKNVQQYFTKSSHYPLKMDGTTSPFGVSEVV